MSEHRATVAWQRGGGEFTYETYSRDHTWAFDGDACVAASAAPAFLGTAGRVDPEEAFVAAVSSCHMLTFLAIAAKKRLVVDGYRDAAVGQLEENADGNLAITSVVLRPEISWSGQPPSADVVARIHELSHRECFIANSVRTEIRVEPAET